ncbi:MAG: DNA cytosine methyltransferase [Chlamydiales bacterium]|nr:DNA cytosine methyltransferase [Chlamydiales bacterium]
METSQNFIQKTTGGGYRTIVTGGFPCQDISIAGKKKGISGERSGLWFEMWRVISILRPQLAIIENVGRLTVSGLDVVLSCLAQIGYDAVWQSISAEEVGAPHERERVWIIAYPQSESQLKLLQRSSGEERKIQSRRSNFQIELPNSNSERRRDRNNHREERSILHHLNREATEAKSERTEWIGRTSQIRDSSELSNTDGIGCDGRIGEVHSRVESQGTNKEKRSKNRNFAEMVQTCDGHLQWERTFKPEFVRVVDGLPNQLDRIETCGLSLVPMIPEILFRKCMEVGLI